MQPFAQAALELFQEENPDVRITVGGAGTGDGFEKFCRGELDIADASREIEDEEKAACKKATSRYSQVQVANDGIAVVSNKSLPIKCLKTAQLKKLYAPKSTVKNYSDLGSGIPNKPVSLFSPGSESGHVRLLHRDGARDRRRAARGQRADLPRRQRPRDGCLR